jgi:exosortase A
MADMALPIQHRLTPAWHIALPALGLVLVAMGFLYRDTALGMVAIWERSETFAHAFLVPPIVAWLLWRQRDQLLSMAPRPNVWMLLPVAVAAGVWLLGDLATVNSVTQLAFTALLVLAVPALLGACIARAALFPLAFLFFAVPLGEFLLPQLMEWTADFTVAALRLSGIPVFREGLQFVIPSGNWSVVEACSGVRYLIASFMVGTLYAYLTYRSRKRRLIFMAISIVVPVLANWVRAYMIVMLGHLSENKIAAGADHLIYGWVFFGVVIGLLYTIGARWAEAPQAAVALAAGAMPSVRREGRSQAALVIVSVLFVVLVALPPFAQRAIAKIEGAGPPVLVAPATLVDGWQAMATHVADWSPRIDNPSAEVKAAYARGGLEVGLYVGYFRQQDYQHKLVGAENVILGSTDKAWRRVADGQRRLDVAGVPLDLRTADLRRVDAASQVGPPNLIFWQVYWVNGRFTGNEYLARAYVALYRLLGRGDDAAMIVVYAPQTAAGEADAALAAFVQANLGAVDALLRQVASQR